MAIQKVNAKVDFIALEHKILDFWETNEIFQKRVKKNAGKPRWSFIDGPITANNPMGVHHAWGRTLKDLYLRYKAMSGFELRYQNGFDCQGLWVEIEVEKELGFKTKLEIEDFGIEKFVNLCKKRVSKYAEVITNQSKRLGYWMDWENSYFTMSDENNYTIWSFLKKLFEQNKIYRGTDVVPWSGRSGTSYSQMEIIEGRKLVAHDSVFVRFPIIERKNEYLLIWTTTPWTLTSNVAAAVNVDLEYIKLQTADGSIYYFAKDNLEFQRLEKQFDNKREWVDGIPKLKTIAQIFKERGGYKILKTLKGADLVGWKYVGPFDHFKAQNELGGFPFINNALKQQNINGIACHRVIDGGKDSIGRDTVVAGEGTGIVHIAPGCGDIDHKIGIKLGLVDIAPLDDESKFIEGFGGLTGMTATYQETTDKILKNLKDRNSLVHSEKYPHIYPHCWRSGDELVFRMVDEWYIKMDWRNDIKKIVDDINWIPEWGKEREHEWLDNMGDWMISKKRFWGLALPIWTFEDDSFYVVGSKEELKELAVEGWGEFEGHSPHRPWIDKVKIKHPESGLIGTRVFDVGNPWLDAGIVPYSTIKYNSDHAFWEKWFPADFITECFPGQFRNWFYSLLAMSTIMENRAPFKTLLGHALVRDSKGKEMHKSAGNAIWFNDAADKMGVDVMRWLYINHNVENNLNFGYEAANEVRKKILTLWNSYSFFATYAAVDGFNPQKSKIKDSDLTIMDRWIKAKLQYLIKDMIASFEKYRLDKSMRKVELFIEDLSNWYIRRNRRRFWKSEDDADKQAAYNTLYEVLLIFTKLLAPILPFITEEMYKNLVLNLDDSAPESVHLCDYPTVDSKYINAELIKQVDALKKVVELGRSARNKADLKIRQPLQSLFYSINNDNLAKFLTENKSVILDELNVKEIKRVSDSTELIKYSIKPNLATLGQEFGKAIPAIRKAVEVSNVNEMVHKLKSDGTISLNTEMGDFSLTNEHFLIENTSEKGLTAAQEGGLTIAISTILNEKLIQEGIIRDLIRQVQIMRKKADFAVEDRITVHSDFNNEINTALEKFKDYFCNETLTVAVKPSGSDVDFSNTIKIRGAQLALGISRIKN